jgi:non-specific serine/threonine protein kinase
MAAPDSLSPCTPNTQLFDNDSPPQTPSSEFPEYSEDWRFKQTGVLCEWVEDYRHGGFHPVNLRDTFNDGKYEVIRKLGDGAFSTVWLALHLG